MRDSQREKNEEDKPLHRPELLKLSQKVSCACRKKNQRQLKMDDYTKNSDSEKTVAVNNKTKFI